MANPILAEITALLETRGGGLYGLSAVTQTEHALQAAAGAQAAGLGAPLVAAALLHDIGHLVADLGDDPAADGVDDRHEAVGHAWLAAYFGPEVTDPVRLHVAAKRWLCTVEPDYFARLSPDSVRSLDLQGGRMDAAERAAFEAEPHHAAAVALRRLDEAAKVPGLPTPGVAAFLPAVAACLR